MRVLQETNVLKTGCLLLVHEGIFSLKTVDNSFLHDRFLYAGTYCI